MDATVYRPTYASGRAAAAWLRLNAHRGSVSVDRRCQSFPCLLTARRKDEPDGVPADRLYLDGPHDQVMYLAPGNYQLTVETSQSRTVTTFDVVPSNR
jgi:hypothetical protein